MNDNFDKKDNIKKEKLIHSNKIDKKSILAKKMRLNLLRRKEAKKKNNAD